MDMLAVIAQVTQEMPALYTYGPLGVVCGWLMWRDEKRASENRAREQNASSDYRFLGHRIDGLTKAMLVDMTERESCGMHTKRYARDEIAKIDARLPKE